MGRAVEVQTRGILDVASSDPGDSFLAAAVDAARSVARSSQGSKSRFGVVAFAAAEPRWELPSAIRLVEPLTVHHDAVDSALRRTFELGAWGSTDFSTAIAASVSQFSGAETRRRFILLITESPDVYPGEDAYPDWRPYVELAASRGIRIHTFLTNTALVQNSALLEAFARSTQGEFHAVSDPTRLNCVLLESLERP